MPVVINEFEVAPAPPARSESSGKAAQESSAPSPQMVREIEKAFLSDQRREHRLAAY
jgi:hypothetical protein